MSTHNFSVEINATPDQIFQKLADFASYPSWLSESPSFSKVTDIDPLPMCVGTRFIDRGKIGKRYGEVTIFEPPQRFGFSQPMKTQTMGSINVAILYNLTPLEAGTDVERILNLEFTSPISKLLSPILTSVIKKENWRILHALKTQF